MRIARWIGDIGGIISSAMTVRRLLPCVLPRRLGPCRAVPVRRCLGLSSFPAFGPILPASAPSSFFFGPSNPPLGPSFSRLAPSFPLDGSILSRFAPPDFLFGSPRCASGPSKCALAPSLGRAASLLGQDLPSRGWDRPSRGPVRPRRGRDGPKGGTLPSLSRARSSLSGTEPYPSRARRENPGMLRAQKRARARTLREATIPKREGPIPARGAQRTDSVDISIPDHGPGRSGIQELPPLSPPARKRASQWWLPALSRRYSIPSDRLFASRGIKLQEIATPLIDLPGSVL